MFIRITKYVVQNASNNQIRDNGGIYCKKRPDWRRNRETPLAHSFLRLGKCQAVVKTTRYAVILFRWVTYDVSDRVREHHAEASGTN